MAALLTDAEPGQSLWALLERAHRQIEVEIAKLLEPHDLTIDLMKVAYAIDRIDGGTVADLEATCDLDAAELSVRLRALQLRGLVTRPRPKEDPRTASLRFTTQGRVTFRRAHIAIQRCQERVGGWLGSHRAPLVAGLERLAKLPDLPGS